MNLRQRDNAEKMDQGKIPAQVESSDPIYPVQVRAVIRAYSEEGSQESLMRAALVMETWGHVLRPGEAFLQPWHLMEYSSLAGIFTRTIYMPKVDDTKKSMMLPAAPTSEGGSCMDIFFIFGQLAATGYFNERCASAQAMVHPSRNQYKNNTNTAFMTSILCV